MKLRELLYAIDKIAENKGLSKPYIVGGLVRDKLLDRVENIEDVDLTTGDAGIHNLAKHLAVKLGDEADYKEMPDGHSTIYIKNDIKLDFSSNYVIPGITSLLVEAGISRPSEMQKELYSRDFTCNTGLMTLDLETILDPTGLAIEDINKKIIKTCLSPELTLGSDTKRIVRVVYLSAKLDFDIDPSIIDWVRENPNKMAESSRDYLTKKLNSSLNYNEERTVQALNDMNLWSYVPAVSRLAPYMIRGNL